jgi:hypothetical protein
LWKKRDVRARSLPTQQLESNWNIAGTSADARKSQGFVHHAKVAVHPLRELAAALSPSGGTMLETVGLDAEVFDRYLKVD